MNKLNWNRTYFENVFQMSEMLLKSGLVSEKDLGLGQDVCLKNESPLLFVLVKRGTISDVQADKVLSLHQLLSQNLLSIVEATIELRRFVGAGAIAVEDDLAPRTHIRLGEILLAANLVSSADLIASIEKGRSEKGRFGAILVRDFGFAQERLNQALSVQTQINNEFISLYDGVQMAFRQSRKGQHF